MNNVKKICCNCGIGFEVSEDKAKKVFRCSKCLKKYHSDWRNNNRKKVRVGQREWKAKPENKAKVKI